MSHNLRRLLLAATGASALVAYGAAQEDAPVRFGGNSQGQVRVNTLDSPEYQRFKDVRAGAAAAAATPAARLGGSIEATPPATSPPLQGTGGIWSSTPRNYDPQNNVAQITDVRPTTAPVADPAGPTQQLDLGPPPSALTSPVASGQPVHSQPSAVVPGQPVQVPPSAVASGQAAPGPLFRTQNTSFINDPPDRAAISANSSLLPQGQGMPRTPGSPSTGESTHVATKTPDVADKVSASGNSQDGRKLWPVMLLFASVAANVFFCWIAWDAHAKYRDLVSDLSESGTRLEREKRRLRRDETSSRSRDSEDSQYLRTVDA